MLHQLIKPAILIYAIALPLWIVLRLVLSFYSNEGVNYRHEFWLFIFYIYLIGVLLATVVPIPLTRYPRSGLDRLNLLPIVHTLKQLITAFTHKRGFMRSPAMINFAGNIILFAPLGVLLPQVWARYRSLGQLVLFAFLFSTLIESMQYLSQYFGNYRSVDVDDVILNTLGAALGFVIAGRWLAQNISVKNASQLAG